MTDDISVAERAYADEFMSEWLGGRDIWEAELADHGGRGHEPALWHYAVYLYRQGRLGKCTCDLKLLYENAIPNLLTNAREIAEEAVQPFVYVVKATIDDLRDFLHDQMLDCPQHNKIVRPPRYPDVLVSSNIVPGLKVTLNRKYGVPGEPVQYVVTEVEENDS